MSKKYVPMLTVKEKTPTEPAEFVELCTGPCEDVTLDVTGTDNVPITGSLTISAGSVNMTLGAELDALAVLDQTGLIARTGVGSYIGRTLTEGTGINITNANGVAGNPTISALGFTLPYTVQTSSSISSDNRFTISNSSSGAAGYRILNSSTDKAFNVGLDNSTNEAYMFGEMGISLSLWTNGANRLSIDTFGSFNFYGNRLGSVGDPIDDYDGVNKRFVVDYLELTGIQDGKTISVNRKSGGDFSPDIIEIYPDNNFLRRSYTTLIGAAIFGLGTANNSFMIENVNGESAGIAFNGGTDCVTIWTAGDTGSFLNIQDEDIANSRIAYVSTSGYWSVVSSLLNKHSIRNKANNNVLDRFLKVSVKSYGLNYDKKNKRTEKKSNKMTIGFILEELFEIFPNCIDGYYNKLNDVTKNRNKKLKLKDEVDDIKNSGINYNNVLCYLTMAFQEYVLKTNNEIDNLKKKIDYVKNK